MKIYSLALFTAIPGKVIRQGPTETWFFTTRKREAERYSAKVNRRLTGGAWVDVECNVA